MADQHIREEGNKCLNMKDVLLSCSIPDLVFSRISIAILPLSAMRPPCVLVNFKYLTKLS